VYEGLRPVVLTPVELLIMEHAIEDWYGLYELLFDIEGSPPELQQAADRRSVLVIGLRRLLELRLVELGVRDSRTGIPVMASGEEGAALLEAETSWAYPRGNETVVIFAATPLGDRLWQRSQGSA
jgi:hypothetical protein